MFQVSKIQALRKKSPKLGAGEYWAKLIRMLLLKKTTRRLEGHSLKEVEYPDKLQI